MLTLHTKLNMCNMHIAFMLRKKTVPKLQLFFISSYVQIRLLHRLQTRKATTCQDDRLSISFSNVYATEAMT